MDLFVDKFGELINVSKNGQLAMRQMLEAHLRRIERDNKGRVVRLYPFTSTRSPESARAVVIDPRRFFGRPILAGAGVPTVVIGDRYKAGETIEELAADYGRATKEIEEAIRCELPATAA